MEELAQLQRSPEAVLTEMIWGAAVTQLVYVAAELGIADLLEDGPMSVSEIAVATGSHPTTLERVLRALANYHVIRALSGRRFALAPVGNLLRREPEDSKRDLALLFGSYWYGRPRFKLMQSVWTGVSAFDLTHGMSIFEYLEVHSDASRLFIRAMSSTTKGHAKAICEAYDFSWAATIADLGGGRGDLLSTILRGNEECRGILFDLPSVINETSPEDIGPRCDLVKGDFFRSVPEGPDIYILKEVVHNWDDHRVGLLLRRCRQAMRPESRLMICDSVLDHDGCGQIDSLIDIEMLTMTSGGKERTEAQLRELVRRSGLTVTRVIITDSSLINS